jgi:hypothetical protein
MDHAQKEIDLKKLFETNIAKSLFKVQISINLKLHKFCKTASNHKTNAIKQSVISYILKLYMVILQIRI